jgi:hypothetical protein
MKAAIEILDRRIAAMQAYYDYSAERMERGGYCSHQPGEISLAIEELTKIRNQLKEIPEPVMVQGGKLF